jgi:hypothetical protein
VTFDQYLTSKKIDADAFRNAEPALFDTWSIEFEQMHANSFTVQKLNLLNPIRRKYQLKVVMEPSASVPPVTVNPAPATRAVKPMIPKPKTDENV